MLLDSLLDRFRRNKHLRTPSRIPSDECDDDEIVPFDDPFPDPVVIEFHDIIDLHSIPAKQTRAVVEDYIEEALRREVCFVRIIHGKGVGVQREIVRSILEQTPSVVDFRDAPAEAGGWGATIVTLSVRDKSVD